MSTHFLIHGKSIDRTATLGKTGKMCFITSKALNKVNLYSRLSPVITGQIKSTV